jgi:hypothetical protein
MRLEGVDIPKFTNLLTFDGVSVRIMSLVGQINEALHQSLSVSCVDDIIFLPWPISCMSI